MNSIKVMIVDDDRPLSQLVGRILTKSGRYVTVVENDPRCAPQVAEKFRPDVLLLDVDMPHWDGGALLAELRRNPLLASTPAAFVTSLVSAGETRHRMVERGGERYIAKTLDLGMLERGIHELLKSPSK
jgi:DNA-binding response OmpR family regulator